jgi:integrase
VFATAIGTPLSQRNTLRAFKAAVAWRSGLPESTSPHGVRRVTASVLVASGIEPATAISIMGHKNASELLDVYARALRASKRDVAGRPQRLLWGPAEDDPDSRPSRTPEIERGDGVVGADLRSPSSEA